MGISMVRHALVVALLLLACAGGAAAQQSQNNRFVVSDVEVDVSAERTTDARDRAFAEGQRIALGRLVAELTNLPGPFDTSTLTDDQIAGMVQGFQVDSESVSAGRYRASLTYVFQQGPVRQLIEQAALTYAPPTGPRPSDQPVDRRVIASGPVLILPVVRFDGSDRLWDSPNPWLDAWLNYDGVSGGPEIVVPFGDLADVSDITAEGAVAGDRPSLLRIADRYGVDEALVAVAEVSGGGLAVILTRHGPYGEIPPVLVTVDGDGAAPPYAQAVDRVAAVIGDLAPGVSAEVPSGPSNSIAVLVPLRVEADWFQIVRRLRSVPRVDSTDVVSMSATEVIIEITYVGSEDDLRVALSQQGLTLAQGSEALELRRSEDSTPTQ